MGAQEKHKIKIQIESQRLKYNYNKLISYKKPIMFVNNENTTVKTLRTISNNYVGNNASVIFFLFFYIFA